MASFLRVSKATINKADFGKTRDFFFKHSPALILFFEKNNILFPNEYSIRYYNSESLDVNLEHLTRFQLKCARSILNISQLELSNLIGVSKSAISRAEVLENFKIINFPDNNINLALKHLFSEHYIEFSDPFSIFFKKYVDK